jgi:phosphoribosylformimino-5-aminoimidazole carboxamide ribotide isomerase
MRIIPAIDIIEGKCVRLTKGDFSQQKIYNENPLEVAKQFEDAGLEYLHLVDLDGAKAKQIVNHKVLFTIASQTKLKIDFGGGIKTKSDLNVAFNCGANQVTVGSAAVTNRENFLLWLQEFGSSKIILGADFANRKIAIAGWQSISENDVVKFIQDYEKHGVEYVVCTDIAKDGMLAGTSNDIYKEILTASSIKLIASGGVSSLHDLKELKSIGCNAAIVGKAIYEGRISVASLSSINNFS